MRFILFFMEIIELFMSCIAWTFALLEYISITTFSVLILIIIVFDKVVNRLKTLEFEEIKGDDNED